MYDFFSTMPPDMLLRYVRERQAEMRDPGWRARISSRLPPERKPRAVARAVRWRRRATQG